MKFGKRRTISSLGSRVAKWLRDKGFSELPVADMLSDLIIPVTNTHCTVAKGHKRDGRKCVLSVAGRELLRVKVGCVQRFVAYFQFPDVIGRILVPIRTRVALDSWDQGGKFPIGEYKLRGVSSSIRLGAARKRVEANGNAAKKSRKTAKPILLGGPQLRAMCEVK